MVMMMPRKKGGQERSTEYIYKRDETIKLSSQIVDNCVMRANYYDKWER